MLSFRSALLASALTCVGILPAHAAAQQQDSSTAPSTSAAVTTPAVSSVANPNQEIVVTGSVFRRKDLETPSPVTVVSAQQLKERGITTASDAVMSLSSAGGGGIPSAFSANGAFAAGAVGVSLRGLTTDSTLVLQDGLRLADYPLADDGARSFVDLNTIPAGAIERVEVLKDGASATYGADAIAGVVNYIMKKQVTGFSGTVEGGISQHKDAGHQRVELTGGYGDLASQGFNVYVSGEYQHDAMVYNRDRGFPYNTNNLSGKLADDGVSPDVNGDVNGGGFNPLASATTSAVVAPAVETTPGDVLSGAQIQGSHSMVLNPAGCGTGTAAGSSNGDSYCTEDVANRYRALQPDQTRLGVTSRLTVNVGDNAQAYVMGTYYQNREVLPLFNGPPNTATINPISLQNLVLPAMLANGTINPQDPYANTIDPATGQRESALIQYAFGGIPAYTTTMSRTYHISAGINGTFGDDWHYDVGATYMHSQVNSHIYGALNYDALENAVETGSYNFVNPSANSQAQLNALAPTIDAVAKSSLWQIQGTISKKLMDLPGGPLQVAVTGQVHYESLDDPNEDPTNADGSPAAAGINAFSAIGHRYNEAAAFELDAPILQQLEVNASGRYDHYSEGFSHFSPKIGVKITPIHQVILRGTFSKGFRAPSIPETSGSVLGFTTATPPEFVVQAHGNNGYVQPYSLGINTAGNPNLKPELSTSFTGGAVFEPTRWLTLSADYYHIKKDHVIVGGPLYGDAVSDYYAGTALPAGYSVVLNPVDPAHPNSQQTVAIVNAPYENANSLVTSGVDMSATVNYRITDDLRFTSSFEGTWIQKYNITTSSDTQHFAGTVGPYSITSASGTPRWRLNWQNTVNYKKWTLSATAYWTSGYRGTADDYNAVPAGSTDVCAYAVAQTATASGGSVSEQCHVKGFLDVDMVLNYAVTKKFSLYADVYNVANAKAPFDPNTYGGVNYNPAWSQAGVIGRSFRIGANFGF